MRTSFIRCLVLVAAVVLAPSEGEAARGKEDPKRRAQALFEAGVDAARRDHWDEALTLFRRSQALVDRPSTGFNVASALFHLERFREAKDAFEAQLAEGGLDPLLEAEARGYLERSASALGRAETEEEVVIEPTLAAGVTPDPTPPIAPETLAGSAQNLAEPPPVSALGEADALASSGPDSARGIAGLGTPSFATPPSSSIEGEAPSFFERPLFWVITCALVVGAGIGLGLAIRPGDRAPDPGSAGLVLSGLGGGLR